MLKVYVAAGSSEAARAADIIERLRAAGVHVTYDWTPAVLLGSSDLRDPRVAQLEVEAALAADVVWFLVPARGSSGAGFEVGVAYHAGRIVVCSGPHLGAFHFGVLMVEHETDEEVLAWLVARHRAIAEGA